MPKPAALGKIMRILAIGDVTSPKGLAHLKDNLWRIRRAHQVDLCVVNAENASLISGISAEEADALLQAGADVLTGGNHTLSNKSVHSYIDDQAAMLRPINYPADVPGNGYTILAVGGVRVLVINAMGNVHMEPVLDNPYPYIDRVLARETGRYDIAVLDIHAEATGEKVAIGYAYDGRIQVIFGTHTHVPTADLAILPQGTGYVTDVGMCGESGGVLGMDAPSVVRRMRTRLPVKFTPASGTPRADGVLFDVDVTTRRVTAVERISF